MGFDLNFFREPRHGRLTREELAHAFAVYRAGRFRAEGSPVERWQYENLDTGVTFAFDWFEPLDPQRSELPAEREEMLARVPSLADLFRVGKSRGFVTEGEIRRAMAEGVLPRDEGRDMADDCALVAKRLGLAVVPGDAAEFDADEVGRVPVRTPLTLSINFGRPSFFGLEAFELVAALCESLKLVVLDPQSMADGMEPLPAEPSPRALFDSFDKANRYAVQVMAQPTQRTGSGGLMPATALPPMWPRERIHAWWRFSFAKPQLVSRHRDVIVPRIFFMMPEIENEPQALVCWTQGSAIVVPAEGDLPDLLQIVVSDEATPSAPPGMPRGEFLVRWSHAKRILAPFMESYREPVPHLVLNPGRVAAYVWGERLIGGERLDLDAYLEAGVTPDVLVDREYLTMPN